jgi:hypothetical protein
MPSPLTGEGEGMMRGRKELVFDALFPCSFYLLYKKKGIAFYGNVKVIALQGS